MKKNKKSGRCDKAVTGEEYAVEAKLRSNEKYCEKKTKRAWARSFFVKNEYICLMKMCLSFHFSFRVSFCERTLRDWFEICRK